MSNNRDLRLTAAGDLDVSGGTLHHVTAGPEAAKQGATIRLQTFLGEWFLDETAGIPYFERVFIKNPNLTECGEWFRLAITKTPDIAEVVSLMLPPLDGTRKLRVEFVAKSFDGTVFSSKG